MAAVLECQSCGAPAPTAGAAECHYCGAAVVEEAPPRHRRSEVGLPVGGADREVVPDDLPPAPEARRIRGVAVPVVAALVVGAVGFPLTALAVSQVGRVPAREGPAADPAADAGPAAGAPAVPAPSPSGRARLQGAVSYDGPVSSLGCTVAARLATLDAGRDKYSILVNLPAGAQAGTYPLQLTTGTFVALSRLSGGSQTWTSLGQQGATGDVVVQPDRSFTARFQGLQPAGGGAEGVVEGILEVSCG